MIAIYTRLSIDDDESNSIKNQKKEGKAYAKLNGYKEHQILYYDEGEGVKGSAPVDKRKALSLMMSDIKKGKI
ncbi:MAG TPA: recombinase family protein, partial [Flavobacteriaceae bacterium]|nr:recombinase family protein [Flavobacteriaceae bacterium]